TYAISVRTDDGWCGRAMGLVVRAGETLRGVEIVVEPGATLKLRYLGQAAFANYTVSIEGVPCAVDGIQRGTVATVVVPAGKLEVRWSENPASGQYEDSQPVTLAVGEEREMVWSGRP